MIREAAGHTIREIEPFGALEAASVDTDIRPFARFIADRVRWSGEAVEDKTRRG